MIRLVKFNEETAPVLSIIWLVNIHGTVLFKVAVDGKFHVEHNDVIEGWGEVSIDGNNGIIQFSIEDVHDPNIVRNALLEFLKHEDYSKEEIMTVDTAVHSRADWRNLEEYELKLPLDSPWIKEC